MTRSELQAEFTEIYKTNRWGGRVSRSGKGSDPEQTRILVVALKDFIQRGGVRTMVDLGCGDMVWMWDVVVGLSEYWGIDIVHDLVRKNRRAHKFHPSTCHVTFSHTDATRYSIPRVDVVLCRDILCHLEYLDALRLIENVKMSGSKWLIAGTYPEPGRVNPDMPFRPDCIRWYPPVLTMPPFNLPEPMEMLNEGEVPQFVPGYEDKSLGVWDTSTL